MLRIRLLLLGLVSVLSANLAMAQKKEQPDAQDERRSAAIASIAMASQLASIGRGEATEETVLGKSFKSPELLVAAGGLLMQAAGVLGNELDSITEKGEVDKKSKAVTLKSQAKDLFDEAIAMVAGNADKEKALQALIKKASTVEESRGAVGRPRTITRVLAPGQSATITIPFLPAAPGTISYVSVGGARQRCEIINHRGSTIYDNTGRDGTHNFKAARDTQPRMITVRLTNVGSATHTVTVTTN
jgi:hypothetical protein